MTDHSPTPGAPSHDRPSDAAVREEEQQDLDNALEGLARVTVGAQSLDATLNRIAHLVVAAIPGADGAGVAMLEAGHPDTVCVSDPFVYDVDRIQYDLGEGPCITAAAEAVAVLSSSLSSDRRWPRFAPRTHALEVNSVVSIPMVMPDGEVMGALNVYARARDQFGEDAAEKGMVFAAAAAVAVNNARALMQARRLADQLKIALNSRATIDHAIGIMMSRQGGSPQDAFNALKQMSQNQNVRLSVIAERVVAEAVSRARARHGRAQPS